MSPGPTPDGPADPTRVEELALGEAEPAATAAWGPMEVLLAVVAVMAVLFGLSTALVVVEAIFGPELDSLGVTLVAQALLAVTLIGVAFGFVSSAMRGPGAAAALGLRRFDRSAIGWMGVAYGAYWAFAIAYVVTVGPPEQEDIAGELGVGEGVLATIAAGVLIVGAAPVAEEVFFRGFMFAGLRRALPLWAAALISGAVFGLTHAPTGLSAVPQLAALGLILALLYAKTRSLWPSILVHLMNNSLAFAILVL